ncbi:MAG: hypothetical protein P8163_18060 [Candidatus Thiodiazotropha sp.]
MTQDKARPAVNGCRIGGSIDSPQKMAYLINHTDGDVLSHANIEQ